MRLSRLLCLHPHARSKSWFPTSRLSWQLGFHQNALHSCCLMSPLQSVTEVTSFCHVPSYRLSFLSEFASLKINPGRAFGGGCSVVRHVCWVWFSGGVMGSGGVVSTCPVCRSRRAQGLQRHPRSLGSDAEGSRAGGIQGQTWLFPALHVCPRARGGRGPCCSCRVTTGRLCGWSPRPGRARPPLCRHCVALSGLSSQ